MLKFARCPECGCLVEVLRIMPHSPIVIYSFHRFQGLRCNGSHKPVDK